MLKSTPSPQSFAVMSLSAAVLVASFACAPPDDGNKDKDKTPEPEVCRSPPGTTLTGVGSVMESVTWSEAFRPDGSAPPFSLDSFYCDEEYANYSSITFVLVAEWCPNCPAYLAEIESKAAELEAAGSLLVIVDTETQTLGVLPSSESATNYVDSHIGPGVGIRVGELNADPVGLIAGSMILEFLPNAFVVRKSDMSVVATQTDWELNLAIEDVVADLDRDWSNPQKPPFQPWCEADADEASEPNNLPSNAAPIAAGVHEGGVCELRADRYRIDIEGEWRAELAFDGARADLDFYAVEQGTYDLFLVNDVAVGGYTINEPEVFTHSGPADVEVVGYEGATAAYTLTLTEL